MTGKDKEERIEPEENAPELSFDFVDGDVKIVFGLNFGFEF